MNLLVGLLTALCFAMSACGDSDGSSGQSDQLTLDSFNQLSLIEIKLRWQDEYFPLGFLEISPDSQEHRLHRLTIDHGATTIKDEYWDFTGTDSSQVTSSEVDRDSAVYSSMRDFLVGQPYLCVFEGESCDGPAQPVVSFGLSDGTTNSGYYRTSGSCGDVGQQYRLCSQELLEFIESLRTGRE